MISQTRHKLHILLHNSHHLGVVVGRILLTKWSYGVRNLLNVVFFVPSSEWDTDAKHDNCEGQIPAVQLSIFLLFLLQKHCCETVCTRGDCFLTIDIKLMLEGKESPSYVHHFCFSIVDHGAFYERHGGLCSGKDRSIFAKFNALIVCRVWSSEMNNIFLTSAEDKVVETAIPLLCLRFCKSQ